MKNYTAPTPSFSWLPDEIAANCLARVSKSQYSSLSSVCKRFQSLLSSPEIHAARSEIGATEPRLYLRCERVRKGKHRSGWYNLRSVSSNCDDEERIKKSELRLKRSSSSSARLKEAFLAVGSEMYQFGGITNKGKRCRTVRVFDCRSHTQRRAPNMRMKREGAKACLFDGNIYVMGGCSRGESWGEVFHIKTQTWNKDLLPSPTGDDDFDSNYQLVVLGERLYVITLHNKYVYDPKEGRRWLLLDKPCFPRLSFILITGSVWCLVDNLVFMEFSDDLFWYDVSCGGKWLRVEGLTRLLSTKVDCLYRMIQLVNYGGKLVIVWIVLPDYDFVYNKKPSIPQQRRTWFAVISLEKRGLAIWGEIEQLNSLVHRPYTPLACLSISL